MAFRIEHVTVIDGTGADGYVGTVTVDGDRITEVTTDPDHPTGEGRGLVLSPGFVDVHCHDDWAVLLAPEHRCKTLQGVTSVVNGNCGYSPAPAGASIAGTATYARLADYFADVEREPPSVNLASLIGHNAVRASVMGLREDRSPTAAERAQMAAIVEAAMVDGAVGLSSGLAYEPGRYATQDELVELAQIVAAAGGLYATHMRDESDGLIDSVVESIAVAESAGVPLQISHLKAAGHENWGRVSEALRLIDAARERGVDVMADQYPYTRGSSLLEQIVNGGALDGPSPFGHMTTDQVLVAAAPRHPEWEGRTVTEIAGTEGLAPREMADRIVELEGRACIVVVDMMDEADVELVMRHPVVMTGSDGVPAGDKPHPRLHHTFPRVLGEYVRGRGLLDLPTAIHRMTGMPAARFGFIDRGVIRPGAFADLVLFDPATIADTGTYADPTSVPAGIVGVWVNGERVVADGDHTGARPGRVLRRPSPRANEGRVGVSG